MEQTRGRVFSGLVWWLLLFSGCACLNTLCSDNVLLRAEFGRSKTISFFNDQGNLTESNCGWRLKASEADEVVQLRLVTVDFTGGDECAWDSLAIFDSSEPYLDRRLAMVCGHDREFQQFSSSGRSLFVQFKARHLDILEGFSLRYRAAKRWGDGASSTTDNTPQYDIHTATTLNASQGEFQYVSSPEYPSPYHSQESLLWVIRGGPGEVVLLHVEDMDLQTLANCGPNTVTVYDSDSEQGRQLAVMCNVKYRGADLYSTGQAMTIAFTSARADYGRGFDLGYKAAPSTQVKTSNVWTPGTDDYDDDDGSSTRISHNVVMVASVSGSLLLIAGLIIALGVYGRHRWIIRPRSAGRVISVPGSDVESSRALLDHESPEPSDSESEEPGHHHHHHHHPPPEDSQNHIDVPALNLWMSTHLPEMAANQLNMADSRHNRAARQPNEAASQPTVGAHQPNMAVHHPNMAAHHPDMVAHHPDMVAHHPDMAAHQPRMAASYRDASASHREAPTIHSLSWNSGLTNSAYSP